jgi:integrase
MPSDRIVRKTLANGTVRIYRYARDVGPRSRNTPGTVGALIEAYKRSPEWRGLRPASVKHKLAYLRILETVADLPVVDLRRRVVLRLRDEIAAERGDATANCFVAVSSALLSWAVKREEIESNPVRGIERLAGGHLRAWTVQEYAQIVPRLPEPLRRVAVLARFTGQRRGDLCAARWSQYDGRVIRLVQRKTGAELVIPAAAELRAEMDSWRGGPVTPHPDMPILTTHNGAQWDAEYLSSLFWQQVVIAGGPAARGLTIHGFRKLCAADLIELGCSEHEAAAITGHSDMTTLRLYTRSARQEHLAHAAIARVDNRA